MRSWHWTSPRALSRREPGKLQGKRKDQDHRHKKGRGLGAGPVPMAGNSDLWQRRKSKGRNRRQRHDVGELTLLVLVVETSVTTKFTATDFMIETWTLSTSPHRWVSNLQIETLHFSSLCAYFKKLIVMFRSLSSILITVVRVGIFLPLLSVMVNILEIECLTATQSTLIYCKDFILHLNLNTKILV